MRRRQKPLGFLSVGRPILAGMKVFTPRSSRAYSCTCSPSYPASAKSDTISTRPVEVQGPNRVVNIANTMVAQAPFATSRPRFKSSSELGLIALYGDDGNDWLENRTGTATAKGAKSLVSGGGGFDVLIGGSNRDVVYGGGHQPVRIFSNYRLADFYYQRNAPPAGNLATAVVTDPAYFNLVQGENDDLRSTARLVNTETLATVIETVTIAPFVHFVAVQ